MTVITARYRLYRDSQVSDRTTARIKWLYYVEQQNSSHDCL